MFIIEGLVYYLPPEAFKASLTGISETAVAGSRLFFDFLHLDALSNEITMPGLETLLVVSSRLPTELSDALAIVHHELPLVRLLVWAGSRLFFDFLHLDALSNEITMPGLETLLVVSGHLLLLKVDAVVGAAALGTAVRSGRQQAVM
jgi:hypothetical protein